MKLSIFIAWRFKYFKNLLNNFQYDIDDRRWWLLRVGESLSHFLYIIKT